MTWTVAIVGASGQIGRALCDAFGREADWRVVPLTHAEIEVADRASVERALDPAKAPAPEVVINTAFTFSPDPEVALRGNALGAGLLAGQCRRLGALLVQISTDYVFDGDAGRPYTEADRTEPRSVYGISKLAGEHLVRATAPRHLIVRVSSLYGAGGSRAKGGTNFVSDMLDMQRVGRRIQMVTDQHHSPTYARDAAGTIVELVGRGVTGTVHVSNAGWCSKYDFAARIFQLAGLEADLVPIRLADLPPGPSRPRNTALALEGLRAAGVPEPRPWEEGLRAYLQEVGALAPAAERA